MEELENEISTQAEENTVSLASAQALADALAKIEVYTPTTWVDNSSPDIDAEHLNKPEQAIKRVTDALNSAVDVIKDLQSQVTKNSGAISDVNNNLSNKADKTSLSSYALKSDLTWNPVSISELNTNAVISDGGLNNGANIYVSCGRLHIISLSLNLSSDINGSLFKVETGHIPVRSTRIVCTAKSGNITAMPYLDSDGYVITAGTIPAGQVKLLGIYMTA